MWQDNHSGVTLATQLDQYSPSKSSIVDMNCYQIISWGNRSQRRCDFKLMDILNVLVGVTAIFWIAAGIKTHSDWIQSIFVNESKKIRQQIEIINEFGYGTLNTRNTLEVKKGLVFAYWDKPLGKQKSEGTPKQMQSPIIFQLVSLNLITCTSVALLIVLSRGLFSILGLI